MPAAAVIPAPVAYIKVVAVKKLVVGFLVGEFGRLNEFVPIFFRHPWGKLAWHSVVEFGIPIVYCEKIRVFKAGLCR